MSYLSGTNAELIYVNTASGTAKNTFTTEVGINDVAGMGAMAHVPADFWLPPYGVGRALRIVARGILSSTGTPTYTFTIRLGTQGAITGPIVLGTAALTTLSSVTNQLFEVQGCIVMRSIGAAGGNSTVQGLGMLDCPGGLASPGTFAIWAGAASPGTVATVDTSIVNFVNFDVTCSASSVSNQVQLLQLQVWGLN